MDSTTHGTAWEIGVAAVRDYAAAHGHARVPQRYMSPDGHRTGQWVSNRRRDYCVGRLSAARISELEAISGWVWSWNSRVDNWLIGLAAVRAYAAENGHARIPQSYASPDGHRTGWWVAKRRVDYASQSLGDDRVGELEAIPGWVWGALDAKWETNVAAVRAYAAENGHARVPYDYVSPRGHKIGIWVSSRRKDYGAGNLSDARIVELEAISGWVWNSRDEQWVAAICALHTYAAENGHAHVPVTYVSPDGHRTGNWVSTRRRDYAAGKLTTERIAELESLPGWVWGALNAKWAAGLAAVREYVAENGHACVPDSYVSPDGNRTGAWVRRRRGDYAAGKLTAEQITELESILGWVWTGLNDSWWVDGLAAVRGYVASNGHAHVPDRHVSPDGHPTGRWVRRRRGDYAAGKLTPDRIAQLESIPGWVWRAR